MPELSVDALRLQMPEPVPNPGPIPIQDPPPDQGGVPLPEAPPDPAPSPVPMNMGWRRTSSPVAGKRLEAELDAAHTHDALDGTLVQLAGRGEHVHGYRRQTSVLRLHLSHFARLSLDSASLRKATH